MLSPTSSPLLLSSFFFKTPSFTEIRSFNNLGGQPWMTQLLAFKFQIHHFTPSIYLWRIGGMLIIHTNLSSVFTSDTNKQKQRKMEALMKQDVVGIPFGMAAFRPAEKSLKRLFPAPVGNQSPDGEPRAKQCKTSVFF